MKFVLDGQKIWLCVDPIRASRLDEATYKQITAMYPRAKRGTRLKRAAG